MPEDIDGWTWELIAGSHAVRGEVTESQCSPQQVYQQGDDRRYDSKCEALPVAK